MIPEKKKFQPLLSDGVCLTYELLHKRGLVAFPITRDARDKVEALVASVNSSYFGTHLYFSHEEKAVAYLYFTIKNHCFVDGNKRTGVLVFHIICAMNNLKVFSSDVFMDEVAVYIEQIKETDHRRVIKKLANFLFFGTDSM